MKLKTHKQISIFVMCFMWINLKNRKNVCGLNDNLL